jgi:CMP-N-acetylneuraminic acid synthetase
MKTGKLVTTVPSRLGSNRVPMKGMRLLGEKTLIEHTISAIKGSQYFSDTVYINSDAPQWEKLAAELEVLFYQRPAELATSKSMIDEYLFDFISQIEMDYLAVITPTAPFVSSSELDAAWETYAKSDANTLISAEGLQTHCFYQGEALNFNRDVQLPRSQDLKPVHALNFSIAIYDARFFKAFYEKHGFAVLAGDIITFLLDGFSTIDIDEEKDFILAELALRFQTEQAAYKPRFSEHIKTILDAEIDTRN